MQKNTDQWSKQRIENHLNGQADDGQAAQLPLKRIIYFGLLLHLTYSMYVLHMECL